MSTMLEDNITERKEDIKYLTTLVKRLETDTDKERKLADDLQILPVAWTSQPGQNNDLRILRR